MNQYLLIGLLVFGMGASGCSHKKPAPDQGASAAIGDSDLGSSDDGKAMGLKTVHFAYDSSTLNSEAKALVRENAGILKEHSGLQVQIEGHCDARGGIQYNIALGERRANSVKRLLEDQGVSSSQLTTISYGKERPLVSGEGDAAYAQNRRANFIVTAKH